MICRIEMGKVFSPPPCQHVFRQLIAQAGCRVGHASAICHFLMALCLRTTVTKDYTQYQMDLQQCEGLAVQNQPDAPQWVQLLAQSAVVPGRKRPKRVPESV